VIGLGRGAVHEVISDCVTRYFVGTLDDMVAAVSMVAAVGRLPHLCRAVWEGYLDLYAQPIARVVGEAGTRSARSVPAG
jgi:hypothetical protein